MKTGRFMQGAYWAIYILLLFWAAGGVGLAQNPDSAAKQDDTENQFRLICAGMGFQNGYLDGYEIGLNDFRYQGKTDCRTQPLYEKGERGYNDKWKYFVIYQRAYRRGFEQGYNDGFDRKDNLVINRFAQLEDAMAESATTPLRSDHPRVEGPVTLPAGTTMLLQLNDYLTTRMSQRGDPFTAVMTRDVFVGNALAIPQGTIIEGTVGRVERPGRVKGKAEMNLRFERVKFKTGQVIPLSATLSGVGQDRGKIADREGTYQGKDSHGTDTAVIAGGAGAGTVVGVIAGGGKGAGIGAVVGGLVGLAGVLSTRGEEIELPKGILLEIMLDQELKIE